MTKAERIKQCNDNAATAIAEAVDLLEGAASALRDGADADDVAEEVAKALLHLGEARGWRNAVSDLREKSL